MPAKVKYPEYIAIRLETEMKKKLQEMADAEERTIGSMIRIVLREGLEARESKKWRKKSP
jgi:predicted transcriptional regulator